MLAFFLFKMKDFPTYLESLLPKSENSVEELSFVCYTGRPARTPIALSPPPT